MKTVFNFSGLRALGAFAAVLMVCVFVCLVSSCDKGDVLAPVEESIVESSDSPTTRTAGVYNCAPSEGNFTPTSSNSVVIGGTCGTHDGGVIKAKVSEKTGNAFTIQITKKDNTSFATGATGYVKSGSLCGPSLANKSYNMLMLALTLPPITPNFTNGVLHLYPMVISGSSRLYAEPVMIYTSPMHDYTWTLGHVLGTVNGVGVKCNGPSNQSSTNNYQCTEFCIRYYNEVYGMNYVHYLSAKNWFGDYTNFPTLERCSDGSKAPRPGDILCMGSTGTGNGHVAIIIEVNGDNVKVAQQNSGTSGGAWEPIGGELTYNSSTKKITPPSGYTMQGWLRIPNYQY